jgi:hypothetical protein
LLLGNDLAGNKTVVSSLLTITPNLDETPGFVEQEIPDLYQSCTVTRAMAYKAKVKRLVKPLIVKERSLTT